MDFEKIEGITLDILEKNESDAIIKVLTKNKIFYLLAKGFFKINGKNKSNIFVGSISEFEYFTQYGKEQNFLLKKANIKYFFDYYSNSYKNILNDIFFIFKQIENPNEKFYKTYVQYFYNNKETYYKYFFITYLMNILLEIKGKKLNNSFCSKCGTNQNLYCVNMYEGGIFCYFHKIPNSIIDLIKIKAFCYLGMDFDKYVLYSDEETNSFWLKQLKEFIYH